MKQFIVSGYSVWTRQWIEVVVDARNAKDAEHIASRSGAFDEVREVRVAN